MRALCPSAPEAIPPVKPKGGYRVISIPILVAAWLSYRLKFIRLVDLRVWFAFHEMEARRCLAEPPLQGRFTIKEARKLTGLSAKRIQDASRRLQSAKVLVPTPNGLACPTAADDLSSTNTPDYPELLDGIPNASRKIPVPRRILRLLAGGSRPALIATILGHLIRGLYLKQGKCEGRGRVKASWIADTFGVGLRRVKEARHELIAIGWLIPLEADQWALNRWGAHFLINLGWSRLDRAEGNCTELAPPTAVSEPQLAPPDSDKEPLSGREKNQKPATGGPAGVCIAEELAKTTEPCPIELRETHAVPSEQRAEEPKAAVASPAKVSVELGKPSLRNVLVEDLNDIARLMNLLEQAITQDWITSSERDRLRFVGAAEHARVIGATNPCGLFIRLVRGKLWSFITQDDEDAANVRLKRHLHGKPLEKVTGGESARKSVDFLSDDALTVRSIRGAVAATGYRGDAFPFLKRQDPAWTRERWDLALAELGQATTIGRVFVGARLTSI